MEFTTPAQQQVYEKIAPWVRELFGTFALQRDDMPAFMVSVGSATAHIFVLPWSEENASVTVRAYVVKGAEITNDLMYYLLRENDNMRFGAFGLDKDNDIYFEHAIVGSTCDKEELRASVMAVILTSDKYDDQLVSRWGGQRELEN